MFFVGVIVAGAYAYQYVEGWSLLDAFYFVIVTVTTIGYGDFVPITSIGKIFTMFFSFFGVAMAFYFLSLVGSALFKKHVSAKVTEIKREVQKQEDIKEQIVEVVKEEKKKR